MCIYRKYYLEVGSSNGDHIFCNEMCLDDETLLVGETFLADETHLVDLNLRI